MVKNLPASAGDARNMGLIPELGRSPGEGEIATHSSILARRIPCSEEPGGLQSMGSQRFGHDLVTQHAEHPYVVGITATSIEPICSFNPSAHFQHHSIPSPEHGSEQSPEMNGKMIWEDDSRVLTPVD